WRFEGRPAPALSAGHPARQHPRDDAAPRGRAGRRHREVRRQHRRLLGSLNVKARWSFARTVVAAAALAQAAAGYAQSPNANRPAGAAGGPSQQKPRKGGRGREAVTRRDVDGSTPLQWAVYAGDVAEVKRLLRAGANLSLANNYGATPMSLAAEVGSAE